ncbi:unnamed protein product [Rodentolepis nana]|uniref:LSDAT_euk domain-containing protein n=1 Tax=Rodentolepis nana TaxID=102285 RepID=A0A0R3TXW6_RODNA|nr:unnamed protein product [Rodentolepis nana]
MKTSYTDFLVVDNEIYSSDEDEQEIPFSKSSYRAFSPLLDHWEQRIVRCLFSDNLDCFIKSCAETAMFIRKHVIVNYIENLPLYRAMKFPDSLNQASIIHIVLLFSAHRILEYLLNEYPASKIWSTTEEGINALHVAAALGDYMALRMLLQRKDAPISKSDKLKRTALHYAAETNLESVITLLSFDKQLLTCKDINELTPLQFIRNERQPKMNQFLKFHTELIEKSEGNEESGGADSGKAINMRNLMEAPLLFDTYVCIYQAQRQDNICENCNTRSNNHEIFSENDAFTRVIASRKYGFVRRPTNTFGQFEKTFSPVVSQYIRLAESTTVEKLELLLFDLWQMPKPGLILSFYGTDPVSPSLQKLLQKSLGRITRQTRTWILTDGREKCAGDVVSKVVKAHAEAYGMHQLQVICLVPWRKLYNSHVLRCSDYMGREQMAFPKKPPENDTRIQLAENHTHYIFLDSRENLKDLPLCRTQFEAFVGHLSDHIGGASELSGDKENHLLSSRKQLLDQGMPKRLNSPFRLPKGLTSNFPLCVPLIDLANRVPVCGILIEGDRSNLLGISYEDSVEMDARILQSFVKPELFEGVDEEESWDFKIRIALSLNRMDILPENMFSRVHWKDKKGMKELVTKCLKENNAKFIRLLVDSGFPLHEYIDDNLLAKLYKDDFNSNDPRFEFFRKYVLSLTPIPQVFRWAQIRKIVKSLLGFEPGIRLASPKSRARRAASLDVLLTLSENRYECNDGEEILLQLLIWSFLCRRFDLSHLIWTLMKDAIPTALMLACLARKMLLQQQSQREVTELDKMAE